MFLKTVTGPFCDGRMTNDNGQRLIDLASQAGLIVTNTLFSHKRIHTWTWMPPSRTGKGAVKDYILVDERSRSSVQDVRVYRGAEIDSDHHMVMMRYSLSLKAQDKMVKMGDRKVAKGLADEKMGELFESVLKKSMKAERLSVDEEWENIRDGITTAAEAVAKKIPKMKRKPWLSDETFLLVDEKQKAYARWQQKRSSEPLRRSYQDLRNEVAVAIKKDRNQWLAAQATEMEEDAKKHRTLPLFGKIRQLCRPPGKAIGVLKSATGAILATAEEKRARWREHFEATLNVVHVPASTSEEGPKECESGDEQNGGGGRQDEVDPKSSMEPTVEEVRAAIGKIKRGKACGADGVYGEMLRSGGEALVVRMHGLIVKIWRQEHVPQDWRDAVVIPLFKKGDRKVCDNYRPISLLSVAGKVLIMILEKRMRELIEPQLAEGQCGFRRGRGTVDQIFVTRMISEMAVQHRVVLHASFVDLSKAFDSVPRDKMWDMLRQLGIPDKLIRLVQELYRDLQARVRAEDGLSEAFNVDTGVRQGCILSPLLFIAFMEGILRDAFGDVVADDALVLEYRKFGALKGWRLGAEKEVCIIWLGYADDLMIVSEKAEGLQRAMTRLDGAMCRAGMSVNSKKTKVMLFGKTDAVVPAPKIVLRSGPLEVVEEFCYLGSTLAADGRLDREVEERIAKASRAFDALHKVAWKRPEISLTTKVALYRACVLSSLLYGAETWTLLAAHTRRLEAFHHRCLRRILRVWWWEKVTNEEVRERTGMGLLSTIIQKRRLQWVGHVERMGEDRMPRVLLDGRLKGRKKAFAGARKKWVDIIRKEVEAAGVQADRVPELIETAQSGETS